MVSAAWNGPDPGECTRPDSHDGFWELRSLWRDCDQAMTDGRGIRYPAAGIRHPASGIRHPANRMLATIGLPPAARPRTPILSLDSRGLLKATRSGQVLGWIDLGAFTTQAIEGVTIDENAGIYLVAEDSGTPNSRLFQISFISSESAVRIPTEIINYVVIPARRRRSLPAFAGAEALG